MTAVKKATALKRAPRAAVPAPVENVEVAADEPKTVTFQGRVIAVKLPTGEQLAAWRRILGKLENASTENMSAERALALLERATDIIDSVIVNEEDVDWLDQGRVRGTIEIKESLSIVTDTVSAYRDELPGTEVPNRAARRKRA